MSLSENTPIIQVNNMRVFYDALLMPDPSVNYFDIQWLKDNTTISLVTNGRGEAWFVDSDNQHWVLRHYMRGGMVARWNRQTYLGWKLTNTRAWKEWHLLKELTRLNLPVPKPVAACVNWIHGKGKGLYQAYILVERLQKTKTFANILNESPVSENLWWKVGACIRQFHDHNVFHADLNANNVLIDSEEKVFVIDFDRGQIKKDGEWKNSNINRLKRSLVKLQNSNKIKYFSEDKWMSLLAGYEENNFE